MNLCITLPWIPIFSLHISFVLRLDRSLVPYLFTFWVDSWCHGNHRQLFMGKAKPLKQESTKNQVHTQFLWYIMIFIHPDCFGVSSSVLNIYRPEKCQHCRKCNGTRWPLGCDAQSNKKKKRKWHLKISTKPQISLRAVSHRNYFSLLTTSSIKNERLTTMIWQTSVPGMTVWTVWDIFSFVLA